MTAAGCADLTRKMAAILGWQVQNLRVFTHRGSGQTVYGWVVHHRSGVTAIHINRAAQQGQPATLLTTLLHELMHAELEQREVHAHDWTYRHHYLGALWPLCTRRSPTGLVDAALRLIALLLPWWGVDGIVWLYWRVLLLCPSALVPDQLALLLRGAQDSVE